jgi:molybdopterin converting factor small subunit
MPQDRFPPQPAQRYFSDMATTHAAALRVRVLLFGSYAEALGFDLTELSLQPSSRVGDAVERLRALPGGEKLPVRPLCARNLCQVGLEDPLSPEDELALLPPLSGG